MKLLLWPLYTKILEHKLSFTRFKGRFATQAGNFPVAIRGRFLSNQLVLRAAVMTRIVRCHKSPIARACPNLSIKGRGHIGFYGDKATRSIGRWSNGTLGQRTLDLTPRDGEARKTRLAPERNRSRATTCGQSESEPRQRVGIRRLSDAKQDRQALAMLRSRQICRQSHRGHDGGHIRHRAT